MNVAMNVGNHSNESYLIGQVDSKVNHAMNIIIINKSTSSADYYKLHDKNNVLETINNMQSKFCKLLVSSCYGHTG